MVADICLVTLSYQLKSSRLGFLDFEDSCAFGRFPWFDVSLSIYIKHLEERKPSTTFSDIWMPNIVITTALLAASVTVANGALNAPLMVMQFDIPSCGQKIKTSYNT